MELYHGTSLSEGLRIIEEGVIRKDIKRVLNQTEDGFVYLTPSLSFASHWGQFKSMDNDEKEFFVFRVEIEEDKLLKDDDEEAIMEQWIPLIRQCSITESMRLILSSRVKFDITKEEHLMKYVVLPCRDNESSNKSDLTNELTKIFKAERRSMTDQEKEC